MIKSFLKSLFLFFSATARHHCLNESHERKFRALTIPWRHHAQDGMHYKTCLSFFSSMPKDILILLSSLPGELEWMQLLRNARAGRSMALSSLFLG